MNVTHLPKKLRLSALQAARAHVLVEVCLLREQTLIPSDVTLLALLSLAGPQMLAGFCQRAARVLDPACLDVELASRAQNVRNRLVKLEKRQLVSKSRQGDQTRVQVSAYLQLPPSEKPVLLDYQFLYAHDSRQAS